MATFQEHINAEIEVKKAEIAALEKHLADGESWLAMEADLVWKKVRGFFTSTPPAA